MTSFASVDESSTARNATTHFNLLKKYKFKNHNFSLLECNLDTGRTHQIRVHCEYLKHSIVGDVVYSASSKTLFNIDRPLLHAYKLKFVHPINKKTCEFQADLPTDFVRITNLLSLG